MVIKTWEAKTILEENNKTIYRTITPALGVEALEPVI